MQACLVALYRQAASRSSPCPRTLLARGSPDRVSLGVRATGELKRWLWEMMKRAAAFFKPDEETEEEFLDRQY